MTKVGKVMKAVAGTALRAAAAAASAVVMEKMTDAIADKVQELADAESIPKKPRVALRKSKIAAKGKAISTKSKVALPKKARTKRVKTKRKIRP
jgi:hypothetical protein